jgi:hypothetical protein
MPSNVSALSLASTSVVEAPVVGLSAKAGVAAATMSSGRVSATATTPAITRCDKVQARNGAIMVERIMDDVTLLSGSSARNRRWAGR